MIDVCFSETVGGLLQVSKDIIKCDAVLALNLHLNYGYLDCEIIEEQAKRNVESLKYFYKSVTEEDLHEQYKTELKLAHTILKKLKKYLDDGQEIRLWLSNNANDRCGFYWFCDLVKDYDNKVSVISCPGYDYDMMTGEIVETRNLAMFNPFSIAELVDESRSLLSGEILAYANTWKCIVEENAPFRVLIADTVVGVEEAFFDSEILHVVSDEPQTQSYVIGRMLGKWQSSFDVSFVSKRIEHLIKTGKICVAEEKVDDDDCYWPRTLLLGNL